MMLERLITRLEELDPEMVFAHGFSYPHCDIGNYVYLAFTRAQNVTVSSMLKYAKSAVNQTFTKWDGSAFTMIYSTYVVIGENGEFGEAITEAFFDNQLLAIDLATMTERAEKAEARLSLADSFMVSDLRDDGIEVTIRRLYPFDGWIIVMNSEMDFSDSYLGSDGEWHIVPRRDVDLYPSIDAAFAAWEKWKDRQKVVK